MIVVVDYGVGNLGSIRNMFKKAGVEAVATADPTAIEQADRLVLPGVGSFDNAMAKLEASGAVPALSHAVLEQRKPVLGICLGMQLMGSESEEGSAEGLGWIKARSCRFQVEDANLKVPNMGWVDVTAVRPSPLFDVGAENRFYFLHSYFVQCADEADVLATAIYGHEFTCAVAQDNIYGVQFHPEKSHRFGTELFRRFTAVS